MAYVEVFGVAPITNVSPKLTFAPDNQTLRVELTALFPKRGDSKRGDCSCCLLLEAVRLGSPDGEGFNSKKHAGQLFLN